MRVHLVPRAKQALSHKGRFSYYLSWWIVFTMCQHYDFSVHLRVQWVFNVLVEWICQRQILPPIEILKRRSWIIKGFLYRELVPNLLKYSAVGTFTFTYFLKLLSFSSCSWLKNLFSCAILYCVSLKAEKKIYWNFIFIVYYEINYLNLFHCTSLTVDWSP